MGGIPQIRVRVLIRQRVSISLAAELFFCSNDPSNEKKQNNIFINYRKNYEKNFNIDVEAEKKKLTNSLKFSVMFNHYCFHFTGNFVYIFFITVSDDLQSESYSMSPSFFRWVSLIFPRIASMKMRQLLVFYTILLTLFLFLISIYQVVFPFFSYSCQDCL